MMKKREEQPTPLTLRDSLMYVDLRDDGTWNRQSNADPLETGKLIMDIANDYAHPLDTFSSPTLATRGKSSAREFRNWPDAPKPAAEGLASARGVHEQCERSEQGGTRPIGYSVKGYGPPPIRGLRASFRVPGQPEGIHSLSMIFEQRGPV